MASSEHDKGEWAKTADEGIVPDELSGTDAPEDARGEDPEELGSAVTGRTTGSDEPATDAGVDLSAGDRADATTDGGQAVPEGVEPDLRDATAAAREAAKDNA